MTQDIESFRADLKEYFNILEERDPDAELSPAGNWRMSCFENGVSLAKLVASDYFPLESKVVYDAAGAWGGHAYAFALNGPTCYISDLIDHRYEDLLKFVRSHKLNVHPFLADCLKIPLPEESCDVVIGLELVEHIPSVEDFAAEVARVLRPGGVCIISTPAKLKSVYEGEPHYGIKGLALLPFKLQGPIARGIFRKSYPYPIERQYLRSAKIIEPFARHGLTGESIVTGRWARIAESKPFLQGLVKQCFWRYIIIRKSA